MTPTLYFGTLPLILEDMKEVEGPKFTLDSVRFTVLCTASSWRDELAALGIERDKKLPAAWGYRSMWVDNLEPGTRSNATIEVGVSCLGLMLAGEKRKSKAGGTERRFSVGPDESQPGPLRDTDGDYVLETLGRGWYVLDDGTTVPRERYPKIIVAGQEAGPRAAISAGMQRLSVTSSYFAEIRPSTAAVAFPMVPPFEHLDEASNAISAEFTYLRQNVPYGWVLTAREVEVLYESGYETGGEGVGGTLGLFACTDVFSLIPPQEPA